MRRWQIPILAAVVFGVSLAHYLTPVGGHDSHAFYSNHAFYRWFYHLPIILAAFWFGLRGGLVAGLVVTLLYMPHVLFQWGGGSMEQWLEIVLYNIVGVVTGFLSERLRAERDRYREAGEELDRAVGRLKDQTRILLATQEQLRNADRLSALGEMSATLAHEIKTPLASIRGTAEIFSDGRADEGERREFSAILVREVDRLHGVVKRFLELARPRDRTSADADLNGAVREILGLTKVEGRRKGIEFRPALEEDVHPVAMDAEQLKQLILNLVMNAIQAMPDGGALEVRTSSNRSGACLSIADTGHGIPAEIRDRIFEPFVTGRSNGTGLGLSIVRRITENHDAELKIRDRDSGGTEIEVRFSTGGADHE